MSEFVAAFQVMDQIPLAVSVFGSARTQPGSPHYVMAQELGRKLGERGLAVITGGGPGIMEAANKGAFEAAGISVGLNIFLPKEQRANPYQTVSLDFRYFFCRKVMFVKYAIAFVCFPGGFGTLDEFFESMTLIQTGKAERFPVLLVGVDFWAPLIDWLGNRLVRTNAFIDTGDMDLFTVTDDVAEVVERIISCRPRTPIAPTPAAPAADRVTEEGTQQGRPPSHPDGPAQGPP